MLERRLKVHERRLMGRCLRLLKEFLAALLGWRPATLLGYLVAVAVAGIVLALALILGITFHALHLLR